MVRELARICAQLELSRCLGKDRRNKEERREGGRGEEEETEQHLRKGRHRLQPLPLRLHGRVNCFDFHSVLLHQAVQPLPQLLFETLLLLLRLAFDFTKVFLILLLYAFRLRTRLFLGL